MKITAIIVSHNSENFLDKVIDSLSNQTIGPVSILIVDSGSSEIEYVQSKDGLDNVRVILRNNIGFCKANNEGVRQDNGESTYYLFINPDALIAPDWLEKCISYFDKPENDHVACISSPLIRYDPVHDKPIDSYDSLGIDMKWYGRWYDVGQGTAVSKHISDAKALCKVKAICGALILMKGQVARDLLQENGQIFDEAFFMYKDDIELSLRIRQRGWDLMLAMNLVAYHCRGWNNDRKKVPYWARITSVRNEIRLGYRYIPYMLPIYLLKYLYVRFIEK